MIALFHFPLPDSKFRCQYIITIVYTHRSSVTSTYRSAVLTCYSRCVENVGVACSAEQSFRCSEYGSPLYERRGWHSHCRTRCGRLFQHHQVADNECLRQCIPKSCSDRQPNKLTAGETSPHLLMSTPTHLQQYNNNNNNNSLTICEKDLLHELTWPIHNVNYCKDHRCPDSSNEW